MTRATIRDLVRRAAAGERSAEDRLVRRVEPIVRSAVRGRLATNVHAIVDTDDLVQSTVCVVLRDASKASFESDDAVRAWIRAVARNRMLMAARHHRAARRDVARQRHLPTEFERAESSAMPPERVARREERDHVKDAMARLSERDREILDLHSYQQLPFDAVAKQLGLAGESSARQRFHRALRRLARELDA